MAVNFTTNIGLAKPTETEIAKNWVLTQDLIEDNNAIIIDEMDIVVQGTTPTLIATTTPPSFGAGQCQLEYQKFRGFIQGQFIITFVDPTVSSGTGVGSYGISLPELADTTFHTVATSLAETPGNASCVGDGYFNDASSIDGSGTLAFDLMHVAGVAYLRPITETYTGKTQRWVGPGLPVALANGDKLTGNFFYKAA